MHSFITTLAGLFITYATVVTTVYCVNLNGKDLTKDQVIALTRDHFGRTDPDELLHGFFPVWAAIQFIIAGMFLGIALLSFICYILGCRSPPEEATKQLK